MEEEYLENMVCEICGIEKNDVRFECKTECFICDNCLYELINGELDYE